MATSISSKILAVALAAATALSLTACASGSSGDGDETTIRVGGSPGPYTQLFKDGVEPILKEEGYTVDYKDFSDLRQADVALSEGSVDLNVDQHTAYMNVFNDETGSDLINITDIPTAKTKIYSEKYTSVDDVADGQTVGIPQDGSNQTRAFRLLIKQGWITVKDDADPKLLTVADIKDNPHNLQIQPMETATIPRALVDLDWAVIPGSIAYSSKVDPGLAVAEEDLSEDLILQAVTTQDKKDTPWAQAVHDAYRSPDFLDYLERNNEDNYWFVPDSLKAQ